MMVMGIAALLGWGSTRIGRPLLLAWLAIIVMAPAVLVTLDRSAWLAAIVTAGVFAALAAAARLPVVQAAAVCVLFGLFFLLVLVNAVGVNSVASACTSSCATGNGGTTHDETTVRGGTGLSGREYLWQASIQAIKKRPILGYGPGNDVTAIDPYLNATELRKQGLSLNGLSSHSTWFRTAVEMGIPGLALLLGVFLAAGWLYVRQPGGIRAIRDPAQIALGASFIGLLPAMTFESFLLGGVTFTSLYMALALGMVVGPLRQAGVAAQPARLASL